MSDEYFKKSDVLEAIEKDRQYYLARRQYGAEHWTCKVRDTVEDLPTLEVREIKRGKWLSPRWNDKTFEYTDEPYDKFNRNQTGLLKCSCCGCNGACEKYGDYIETAFCPNCGADMRGDTDG